VSSGRERDAVRVRERNPCSREREKEKGGRGVPFSPGPNQAKKARERVRRREGVWYGKMLDEKLGKEAVDCHPLSSN
jgi:hypothetical protein